MFDKEKLVETLRESLEDRRLSREERHELKAIVGDAAQKSDNRAFIRNRVFDLAKEHANTVAPLELLKWSQDVIKAVEAAKPSKRNQLDILFSPGESCLRAIGSLLSSAKISADICVFTITDNRISEEIRRAAKRGISIRIISDNDKSEDTGSDIDSLAESGIAVRMDRSEHHMHHKFAIFDGNSALTGSYNWTRSAASSNRENILICDDSRAVAAYQSEFDRLWREFE